MKTAAPNIFSKKTPEKQRLLEETLLKPGDSQSCGLLLGILIAEGSLDEAARVYSLLKKKKGVGLKPGRMLARACVAAGDSSRSIKVYRDLIRRFPHDYVNFKELEKLYIQIGKPGRAVALYKGIAPAHPLRRKSYKRLTGIYSRLGDLKKAVFYLRKEIKEYGLSAKRCRELGKLYLADRQYLKASQSFQNALAKDRDDRSLRVWLGVALMENGNFKLAEYEFAQLLRERPHGFGELIHMAELRLRENRRKEAAGYLDQAEPLYPGNSRIRLCRAEIAFIESRYREAARLGESALRQTPFYYTWELMRCHRILKHSYRALRQGRKAALHREMQDALVKSRDVFGGLIRIAELKNRNGKPDEGMRILTHILDLYPGNARARVALAESQLLKKHYRKAAALADSVLADTPSRFTVERMRSHAVLARAYRRLGRKKKASHHGRRRAALQSAGQ